jgi:hydrogenase nickel incorporation protein HypA/HybF
MGIYMHETHLINDLMGKIASLTREHHVERIMAVRVRLGALSHFSEDHFREHFLQGARGTAAEGSRLVIETSGDIHDPQAKDIVLLSVDIRK